MTEKNPSTAAEAPKPASSPMELGTGKIGRLLAQYSIPAIVASLATSLYNIVDSIFIGQGVGAMAISGLAITFPLMNLVVAFCTLIAVGGSTISSIFLGQRNPGRATEVLNNVLLLCLIHSIVFGGVTLIFLDPILRLFGATDQTIPYAREFMTIILYGTPISYVFIGLNNIMRATGYPRKAMISALLSVVVNVVLAPVLIFVLEWGIAGAAIATVLGQAAGLVWVLAHFISKKSYIHFDRRRRFFVPQLLSRIYAIGLSPFLMNCCACIVVVFLNKALLEYAGSDGDLAVGAYGILNRTTMFFVMIVFGVTQGMQPILGFNYGAGNWHRVRQTLNRGILIGCAITTFGCVVCELFPDGLSALFTDDPTMTAIAHRAFRLCFSVFAIVGLQIVIQNYFQSIGKPKISIFLSLTRQMLLLLPLLWTLPRWFGLDGVWYSMAGSDALSAVIAYITMLIFNKRYIKRDSAQTR